MSEKFYVGLDITSFENNGKYKPISRVTLLADDDNAYTAGDDSGMELSASCAHATQAMVDSILASVKGFRYQAYSAGDVNIDPSAELGDGVNVSGIYAALSRVEDDGSGFAGISAPGETELEEEYPSSGPMTQMFNRKIATTRSQITKTAEEIRLEVKNEVEGLSASIDIKLDEINSEVTGINGQVSTITQRVDSITSRVTGLEGSYSSLEQYVDSITLTVSNGSTSSTINLKAGGVAIASQTITMNGLVAFTGLANGTTTINGACIKTGLIEANRLDLTGSITFSDLSSSVRNDINDAYAMANSADSTVSGWTYRGSTYIDGGMLMTGTVRASSLEGGQILLINQRGNIAGIMYLANASTAGYAVDLRSEAALRLMASDGYVFIQSGDGSFVQCGGGMVSFGNDIGPAGNGNISCGSSLHKWSSVYAVSGTIQTSDRNKKHDISYNMEKYDVLFDMLSPASFKMNEGTSGRTHVGLISQDVEASLEIAELSTLDFGGFIKTPVLSEGGTVSGHEYALRYDEFVPLCIRQIQELKKRVAELESALKGA